LSLSTVSIHPTPGQALHRLMPLLTTAIAVLTVVPLLSEEQRTLWWPIAVTLTSFSAFFVRYYRPGAPLPIYNLGVVTAGFFLAYVIIPPLWLIFTDVSYNTLLGDAQMSFYQPPADIYVQLVWRYVAFYAAFCITFASVCPADPIPMRPITPLPLTTLIAFLMVAASILLVTMGIEFVYDVSLNPEYGESLQENYNRIQSLPLLVRQFAGIVARLTIVVKMALVAYATARWQDKRWRTALIAIMAVLVFQSIAFAGSRTELFVLVMSFTLSYHHFVRPIRFTTLAAGLPILFVGFLFLGLYRGGESSTLAATSGLTFAEQIEAAKLFFYVPTEFSAIFAGNFDLLMMKASGLINQVPWTIYAYEPLLLIPQQLLPFTKADPQAFYLSLSPVTLRGFFMYGPIAQSILGLDWLELALRGALVAAFFGIMHHKVMKSPASFWTNMFYLYMILFSYTAIRSTTFTFLYFIAFGFVPVYLGTRLMEFLLRRLTRGAAALDGPA
jgi:hypothetical protein